MADPKWEDTQPTSQTSGQTPTWENTEDVGEHYSSPGQQALAAIEGAAQGFAGPIATGAERALSAAGVPGLTPEEQEARAHANPVTHYGSEVGGFGLGLRTGMGQARIMAGAGEAATKLAGLGVESLAARLATAGIKTGAEVAALQAGNEVSKALNNDPNQTLGSAAVNIGLGALLGAGTGVALGGVSELWGKGLAQADGLINDVKQRVAYRQALEAGEVAPEGLATPAAAPSDQIKHVFDPFTKQVRPISVSEELPAVGEETVGTKLGDWIFDKGREALVEKTGQSLGGSIGAVGGVLVGHPLFGAYIGEKTLSPLISSIAKPMLEGMTDGAALKGSLDYIAAAIKGDVALTRAVSSMFEGSKVLAPDMIPSHEDRQKLQERLNGLNDPQNAMAVGQGLNHYLPAHATAAGALVGQAKSYLDSIKPVAQPSTPFNAAAITHWQQNAYNRQLDIAQQPLMALHRANNGTLTQTDVNTLQALYPGLRRAMGDKIQQQLISSQAEGRVLPAAKRQAVGLLLGSTHTDGSMIPSHMQAIIQSQAQQQAQNRSSGAKRGAGPSQEAIKTVNKASELYSTQLNRREAKR